MADYPSYTVCRCAQALIDGASTLPEIRAAVPLNPEWITEALGEMIVRGDVTMCAVFGAPARFFLRMDPRPAPEPLNVVIDVVR